MNEVGFSNAASHYITITLNNHNSNEVDDMHIDNPCASRGANKRIYGRTSTATSDHRFCAFMGYLGSWIIGVSFLVCQFRASDGSQSSMWSAVIGVGIVTALFFSAAFWALCSIWLFPRKHKSARSGNL
jgi:hypothetical protein